MSKVIKVEAWEKLLKRKPRGHPDNLRRIGQLILAKKTKMIKGEIYTLMEEKNEQSH